MGPHEGLLTANARKQPAKEPARGRSAGLLAGMAAGGTPLDFEEVMDLDARMNRERDLGKLQQVNVAISAPGARVVSQK